jgi:hypothetical protein
MIKLRFGFRWQSQLDEKLMKFQDCDLLLIFIEARQSLDVPTEEPATTGLIPMKFPASDRYALECANNALESVHVIQLRARTKVSGS